jgi:hypothetical protein
MRTPRAIASILLAFAGLVLLAAGPVMIYKGFSGQQQIKDQLVAQKITFPAVGSKGLPADLQAYGGVTVTNGEQAKAFATMVEEHIMAATGGKTYSEVSAAYMASGSTDTTLAAQRQTAFMGESLRSSLLGAYQAWQITYLVIALGALFIGLAVVFGATAFALRPAKVKVPESPEVIEHHQTTRTVTAS